MSKVYAVATVFRKPIQTGHEDQLCLKIVRDCETSGDAFLKVFEEEKKTRFPDGGCIMKVVLELQPDHVIAAELEAANARAEQLEQWKKEASSLLDPLLEWGQTQKDIPLGSSITSEILRRAKVFTDAEAKAERYEKALNKIVNQHCSVSGAYTMKDIATEALTAKTTTNDTEQ